MDAFRAWVARVVEDLIIERDNAMKFPVADAAAREATLVLMHSRRTGEKVYKELQAAARDIYDKAVAESAEIVAEARYQADEIERAAKEQYPDDVNQQRAYIDAHMDLTIGHLRGALEALERRRADQTRVPSPV